MSVQWNCRRIWEQANKQDEVNRAYIRGLGKQPLGKVFGLALNS